MADLPVDALRILEALSEGILVVDPDLRIRYANEALAELTGTPVREALGRFCFEVLRCNLCQSRCPVRQVLSGGPPVRGRTGFLVHVRGSRVPVSVTAAALTDESGRILGAVETVRDVGEFTEVGSGSAGPQRLGALVSRSAAMARVFELVRAAARTEATVLLQGETGTGKELVARALHELSSRRDGPFVAVNCAALPDQLLEAELFGVVKGAYTGADRDRPGRFDAAAGGSLFLDEVAELGPALQAKLLRALQERTYEPVGSTQSRRLDARILAATNQDLRRAVEEGRFRQDLYFRLNVVRIELPPLRERREDIPLLVAEFIDHYNRLWNRQVAGVSDAAMALLAAYDWPGNVRELANAVERAFVVCQGDLLEPEHFPEEIRQAGGKGPAASHAAEPDLDRAAREAEAQAILAALERAGGNRTQAARILGIHKSTLYRKMKRLGLEPEGSKPGPEGPERDE